ncbi:MAG: ATP-binding protein [Acidimicrobiales bacterium]
MDLGAELETCLDLESEPSLVAASRLFVAQTLTEWELETLVPDAQLIASELVSNAVLHARTAIRLTLRSDGLRWLRIEVFDQNSRLPLAASCPDDATSGRGLALVEGVGSTWGVVRQQDGKTVWAELGLQPDRAAPECIDLTDARTVADALDRIERSRAATRGGSTDSPEIAV